MDTLKIILNTQMNTLKHILSDIRTIKSSNTYHYSPYVRIRSKRDYKTISKILGINKSGIGYDCGESFLEKIFDFSKKITSLKKYIFNWYM